jgi:hypothetical protein
LNSNKGKAAQSAENPWNANIRLLREQYPGLADQILNAATDPPLEPLIETAASGDPTLIIGGRHVHSPRDPAREARRLAETLSPVGPRIVLGFGLGYTAEAAAALAPDQPVIVVERRPEILRKALETRNFTTFLSRRRVIFVLGGSGEAIVSVLTMLDDPGAHKTEPALIRNPALISVDEEWYTAVERRVRAWASKDDVNMATLRRFGKRWVRNLARNREAIRDLPGISRLAGCLGTDMFVNGAPIPVLLAAAGPSLDEIAPHVRALAERCVIVAVDTSLRFFLDRGIDPDFAVVVDPQYWNARHLDRCPAPRTCLIAESAAYPPVLRHPFARAFLCASLFPLGRFIEDRLDPKGALGAGGSVATSAWDFARTLSPSALWIAGLDLAFPNLKTHFKGALFEGRALNESTRFLPAETRSIQALRDGRPFRAPSASGGEVLTDRRLSLYSAWFEAHFRRPGLPNYSLSPAGLAIPGLEPTPLETLLALPPRRQEIQALLSGTFARVEADFNRPEERRRRAESYEKAQKTLIQGLEEIKNLAEDAADTAQKALARAGSAGENKNIEKILKKLDIINETIIQSEVKEVAGFLFPPIGDLEAELSTPQDDTLARHLELSALLYRSLAEAVQYNLNILS